jgi:hypothetical protein
MTASRWHFSPNLSPHELTTDLQPKLKEINPFTIGIGEIDSGNVGTVPLNGPFGDAYTLRQQISQLNIHAEKNNLLYENIKSERQRMKRERELYIAQEDDIMRQFAEWKRKVELLKTDNMQNIREAVESVLNMEIEQLRARLVARDRTITQLEERLESLRHHGRNFPPLLLILQ